MPDPSPIKLTLAAGRHAICRCGKTGKAPFCDGSHSGSEITPELIDVETERNYAWCVCRTSAKIPACDGSHRNLWRPDPTP